MNFPKETFNTESEKAAVKKLLEISQNTPSPGGKYFHPDLESWMAIKLPANNTKKNPPANHRALSAKGKPPLPLKNSVREIKERPVPYKESTQIKNVSLPVISLHYHENFLKTKIVRTSFMKYPKPRSSSVKDSKETRSDCLNLDIEQITKAIKKILKRDEIKNRVSKENINSSKSPKPHFVTSNRLRNNKIIY
jgi:hypothetical protein